MLSTPLPSHTDEQYLTPLQGAAGESAQEAGQPARAPADLVSPSRLGARAT